MYRLLIVVALLLAMANIVQASDYYTDMQGNIIEVDTTSPTCQPVSYNGQFQGTVEPTPTGQETLDRIFENMR